MPIENDRLRFDRSLADRLQRSDQSVLEGILRQLAPKVKTRLRNRFGGSLNEDDWDDVISMALYRLWVCRGHYDPAKGTLATWFYLITRSLVWDFLRRPNIPVRSSKTLGELVAACPADEDPALHSDDLKRLILALDGLAEVDRRILLAFAARAREDDWTSDLVAELGMPASTIRVRKFRAIAELRDLLRGAVAPFSRVERAMKQTRTESITVETVQSSVGSPEYADFVQNYWDLIQRIAQKLRAFTERRTQMHARGGLAQVESEWNAALALASDERGDERNLQGLERTYAWLGALASPSLEHRKKLGGFLQLLKSVGQNALASIDEQVGDLEQAFSTVTTKLELRMPDDVCRTGEGWIQLEYPTDDVSLRWNGNLSGPPLTLRKLVKSALASSPRFPGQEADAVATLLVKRINAAEELPLPNFCYPPGPKTPPPLRLDWRRAKTPDPEPRENLPAWMRDGQFAPADGEMALFHGDPELAELIDKVAAEAALVDWKERPATFAGSPKPEGEPLPKMGAVQSLLQAIVQASGVAKSDVAALLVPRLLERQERVNNNNAGECAANTNALALLWSELSG